MAKTSSIKKKSHLTKNLFEIIAALKASGEFLEKDILEILSNSLTAAHRKKNKTSENINVIIDLEKEDIFIEVTKVVVDNVLLDGMQINIEEARNIDPNVELGDSIKIKEYPQDYGRIAVKTAMDVAGQKLKYLSQQKIKNEYSSKIGELINGYILQKRGDTIFIDLGKVEAIMPLKHQIPGERYRVEDKIKVILHDIEEERKKPLKVIVSRSEKKFIAKLFEMEVPEIFEGIVKIKAIGRIPGIRSKVVVYSDNSDIDPVGACVGVRGVRIQSIVRELGSERVDIIEYSSSPKDFITNAIAPAVPTLVKIDPIKQSAMVVVADKDLSVAIGKEGSNVKTTSYVTNYKIDVKSEADFSQEMVRPEVKRNFDQLFSQEVKKENEVKDTKEGTPLVELPGLTKRVLKLLYENNINYIEDILALEEENLVNLEGIGESTGKKIMEIISENVEFEEEGEEWEEVTNKGIEEN